MKVTNKTHNKSKKTNTTNNKTYFKIEIENNEVRLPKLPFPRLPTGPSPSDSKDEIFG